VVTGAQLARVAWWIATPFVVLGGACGKVCVERRLQISARAQSAPHARSEHEPRYLITSGPSRPQHGSTRVSSSMDSSISP
jgi:hypothetical protein